MRESIEIYVINLKKDTKKKAEIEAQLKKVNFKFTVTEACYGKELTENELKDFYEEDKAVSVRGNGLTRPQIGCAISHLNIAKKLIDSDLDCAVVLEDDVVLHDDFESTIKEITSEQIPENIDVIQLGCHTFTTWKGFPNRAYPIFKRFNSKFVGGIELFKPLQVAWGLHGYILTKSGARKLIDLNQKLTHPIDFYTSTDKYLNLYLLGREIVGLRDDWYELSTITENCKQLPKVNILKRVYIYVMHKFRYLKIKIKFEILSRVKL